MYTHFGSKVIGQGRASDRGRRAGMIGRGLVTNTAGYTLLIHPPFDPGNLPGTIPKRKSNILIECRKKVHKYIMTASAF